MPLSRPILLALALVGLAAGPARAQFGTPATEFLQAGVGLTPGVGVQVGFATPALTVLTREGAFYADYRFGDAQDARLLVGLGVGGSLRVLRVLLIATDFDPGPYDVDAGLRFGPSFAFSFIEETAATRARQFRLFADLFVRGSVQLRSGRILFAEIGTQPGWIRGGLVVAL